MDDYLERSRSRGTFTKGSRYRRIVGEKGRVRPVLLVGVYLIEVQRHFNSSFCDGQLDDLRGSYFSLHQLTGSSTPVLLKEGGVGVNEGRELGFFWYYRGKNEVTDPFNYDALHELLSSKRIGCKDHKN